MATILVDYENVWQTGGLQGVEYLTADDTLVIFYSQVCRRIRAEYMELIEKSRCEFRCCKLVRPGKNGLDFYIASECGILCQQGEKQFVIVSRDKGFRAVADFFSVRPENEAVCIAITSNIEQGLSILNGADDKERRKLLLDKMRTLDLEVEHARLQERNSMENRIRDALIGTAYEEVAEKVIEFAKISREATPRKLYTGSLHRFGKSDGTEIYRLLKGKVLNL